MTPTEIETAARNAYNALGDTFWSQSEILVLMYMGMTDLSQAGLNMERSYLTSTVVGQREYDFPTNAISIKRIEYNGQRLVPISLTEDDMLTLYNTDTTNQGTPQYYSIWNNVIMLRDIPDTIGNLKVYAYIQPSVPTVLSTLDLDELWHPALVEFVTKEMVLKDGNFKAYEIYDQRWQAWKVRALAWQAQKKRTDSFARVKNEDEYGRNVIGRV